MRSDQRAAAYADAVARRRSFRLDGYTTLAEAGFDGPYVSPIQMSSGALNGPLLMSKDWLDAPTARLRRADLAATGYIADMPFNRVLDRALARIGMTRADIHVAPVFCLLVPERSFALPNRDALASFDAVTRFEILGRIPVALGTDSARVLRQRGVRHIETAHPSARGLSFDARAEKLASAIATSMA